MNGSHPSSVREAWTVERGKVTSGGAPPLAFGRGRRPHVRTGAGEFPAGAHSSSRRRRRALETTVIELRLIAMLAAIGWSSQPVKG